jgi:hypothetical protein
MTICEEYPEYWEEVIKKEFEVLTIRRNSDFNEIFSVKEYDDSGAFLSKVDINHSSHEELGFNGKKDSKDYIERQFHIYSIKRLSDDEVFTIGDIIYSGDFKPTKLETITIRDNGGIAMWGKYHSNMLGEIGLASCIIKKPLFKTEDGVDIYEGDNYWFIILNKANYPALVDKEWKPICIQAENHNPEFTHEELQKNLGNVTFSTKEAAEEYILLNKPSFSYNDIIKAMKKVGIIGGTMDELTEKVKQILIKEKII